MQIVRERDPAAPLPEKRRGDRRGPARAGGQIHSGQGSGGGRHLRRARTCSSPASWSWWSAPASTPATPSASTPPSPSPTRSRAPFCDYTKKLGLGIGIVGLFNIQFIVDQEDNVYVIEVNPRSSRTVPFLSKATGYSLADIATDVILGQSLKEQGYLRHLPRRKGALVRQSAGVLLLQDSRPGRLPVSRNEVHRRGHRL